MFDVPVNNCGSCTPYSFLPESVSFFTASSVFYLNLFLSCKPQSNKGKLRKIILRMSLRVFAAYCTLFVAFKR